MEKKIRKFTKATKIEVLPDILRTLLKDEAIGGKLILVATILALIAANTSLSIAYDSFWTQKFTISLNQLTVTLDLRHWVSEGLMAIFFLVVGLEIKREIIRGELGDIKNTILPIGAAIGGMIVPALLFLAFNYNQPANLNGWAIPIATDIAFALGVISLLGRRVSSSLKVFLLILAIVDDIGAILIIALFYGAGLKLFPLFIGAVIIGLVYLLRINKLINLPIFILAGLALWVAFYKSGIHPSIAGAIVGFIAPLDPHTRGSISERLERLTIPLSTLIIVPLFAFASLGISFGSVYLNSAQALALAGGITAGLVIGKVVGVVLASWLLVKLNVAKLPANTTWLQFTGVGLLAGIGFTVSVFIAELAFDESQLTNIAKTSIIVASSISAIGGYMFLRYKRKVKDLLDI